MIKVGRDFSRNSVWVSEKEALCRGAVVAESRVWRNSSDFLAMSGAGFRGRDGMAALRETQPQNTPSKYIFGKAYSPQVQITQYVRRGYQIV